MSPDHSSRPAASDPNYTVDCDEPDWFASAVAQNGPSPGIEGQGDLVADDLPKLGIEHLRQDLRRPPNVSIEFEEVREGS